MTFFSFFSKISRISRFMIEMNELYQKGLRGMCTSLQYMLYVSRGILPLPQSKDSTARFYLSYMLRAFYLLFLLHHNISPLLKLSSHLRIRLGSFSPRQRYTEDFLYYLCYTLRSYYEIQL